MADIADRTEPGIAGPALAVPAALFAFTVFASAALVFMVEPMMARLVLPLLGGTAAVWNTSLAFFQAALLAGYVYAHLLQRIRRIGAQIGLHLAVLVAAGLTLPLQVSTVFGDPSVTQPALWLVGVLAVSIGAPFAALSATAPLVQAWHARAVRHEGAREPYVLYAASNLGSLIALIAYPVLVEPNFRLHSQTAAWNVGYGGFIVLAAVLGFTVRRAALALEQASRPVTTAASPGDWRERLLWVTLAAIPSSLMLGVTTYVTTDLGSAPFLWVAPLALYLATFIIAFQERPLIPRPVALTLQAASLALCAVFIHFWAGGFLLELAIHLTCFFLTALVCHQALVARRPRAERLTDFYLWMSLGGVIGGGFNAFAAPLLFNSVVEYPALLILACLARPWGRGPVPIWAWAANVGALAGAVIAVQLVFPPPPLAGVMHALSTYVPPVALALTILGLTAVAAFLLRGRAVLFMMAIFVLMVSANKVSDRADTLGSWRGFFGVLSVSHIRLGALGEVKMLQHGTTLHGAQSQVPAYRCHPLIYYGAETPIGQVFRAARQRKSAINVGAVGLGTGAVAAYTRPSDRLRFFEVDPLVIRVATDPRYFSYTTACAFGHIFYTLGDARLTLARQPSGHFDILLIDAFTSDSVPAHLLTVEAVRMYLSKLTPDGVLVLHLSNRNLDLMRPAQAVALAAGGQALKQEFWQSDAVSPIWASSEQAVIVANSRAALAPFLADPRWSTADAEGVQPWTDDYTDLFGALVRRTADHLEGIS
ncbi:MAG: fused MFS/spermidine synthase [Caulobacterales bacterium]